MLVGVPPALNPFGHRDRRIGREVGHRAVPLARTLPPLRFAPRSTRRAARRAASSASGPAAASAAARAAAVAGPEIDVHVRRRFGELHHHHHADALRLQVLDRRQDARALPAARAAEIGQLLVAAAAHELVEERRRLDVDRRDVGRELRHLHGHELHAELRSARRASAAGRCLPTGSVFSSNAALR